MSQSAPPSNRPNVDIVPTLRHDTYSTIAKSNHAGRSVLITGASKGVGRAMAVSFAKAGAATIIITARSSLDATEKEMLAAIKSVKLTGSPPKILKLELDVTSETSVNGAAAEVQKQIGKLDILINNAGYLEDWKPIAETDPTEWWKSWETNVKGVYLVSRAFLPLLLKGDQKTIVNVGSVGGHRTTNGASAYQMCKFAVLRFTQFLVAEYEEQGLLAFTIHPGGVKTELATGMPEYMHVFLNDSAELCGDNVAWMTQNRQEWLAGRYYSVTWDVDELLAKKDEIVQGDKLKMRMVF
jgi:NAD(P)-dependent dehydrogenase (short-subunit alcohol dehydrogenase family)